LNFFVGRLKSCADLVHFNDAVTHSSKVITNQNLVFMRIMSKDNDPIFASMYLSHDYLSNISSGISTGTHLFVKVHRPGDSEVTFSVFELSCHLLLPV